MNKRNAFYIAHNNPRHHYPRVDNKLLTKELLEQEGIAAPELIGVAKTQFHVNQLGEFHANNKQFVIKPSKGSGGKGILVIVDRDGERYVKPSGASISLKEL